MPTEFILTRTHQPPAKITGEKLAAIKSSNASLANVASSNRQWVLLDLYCTQAGTHVAHIQYRGGSRLREQPVDYVCTGKTGAELMRKLDAIDTEEEFVTGWPNEVNPDFIKRHETVCDYADLQYREVLEEARKVLTPNEEPEIIE